METTDRVTSPCKHGHTGLARSTYHVGADFELPSEEELALLAGVVGLPGMPVDVARWVRQTQVAGSCRFVLQAVAIVPSEMTREVQTSDEAQGWDCSHWNALNVMHPARTRSFHTSQSIHLYSYYQCWSQLIHVTVYVDHSIKIIRQMCQRVQLHCAATVESAALTGIPTLVHDSLITCSI